LKSDSAPAPLCAARREPNLFTCIRIVQFTGEPWGSIRSRRFGGTPPGPAVHRWNEASMSTMKDDPTILLAGADPAWAFRRADAAYAEAVSGFNLSIAHTPELVMVPR